MKEFFCNFTYENNDTYPWTFSFLLSLKPNNDLYNLHEIKLKLLKKDYVDRTKIHESTLFGEKISFKYKEDAIKFKLEFL